MHVNEPSAEGAAQESRALMFNRQWGGVVAKIRSVLVGLALIAAVGGIVYLGHRYTVAPVHECEICGRPLHSGHQATVVLKDGHVTQLCCPRCALHYEVHRHGQAARILVSDRAMGVQIEAEKGFYAEGSDEQPCHPTGDTAPREPGVEYSLEFDRCLPSLVAFKDESAAREFIRVHGGRLLTYAQALAAVRGR